MRWMSALLLCVLFASGMAVTTQSPPAVAMQATPSPAARAFCPAEPPAEPRPDLWAVDDPGDTSVTFAPLAEPPGFVKVRDITNPYPDPAPDEGRLVVTLVTLPEHTCILGSTFYPSMVMTVMSGDVSILVEHRPGIGAAPVARISLNGEGAPGPLSIDTPTTVPPGAWVTIENESYVGFRNNTGDSATFLVAGIKMAENPLGGGGHRGRP